MNTTETIRKFEALKLYGISSKYQSIIDQLPSDPAPDLHTAAGMFADAETQWQSDKRTESYIKNARLRLNLSTQEIDCSSARGLGRELWTVLCELRFIKEGTNIVITGPTGVGKSAIACALGRQACVKGYKTRYYNMNRLAEEIKAARLSGAYIKLIDQLAKVPLLLIDDFGLKVLDKDVRVAFYEILEDRIGRGATIITSQLPIPQWYDKFGEKTIGEACLDRITGSAQKIALTGDSRRTRKA